MTTTFQINFENKEQVNKLLAFLSSLKVNFKFTETDLSETMPYDIDDENSIINGNMIMTLLDTNPAFDFLKSEQEDIYSDSDLKIKY